MDMVLLGVTVVSVVVAVAMTVLARNAARAERLRSSARVAALRAAAAAAPESAAAVVAGSVAVAESVAVGEARVPAAWPPLRPSRVAPVRAGSPAEPPSTTTVGDGFLGATAPHSDSGGRQRNLAMAAAMLFVIAIGGGYWTVFAGRAPGATAASTTAGQALELVSLRHERRGAKLDVVGLVRNPVAGTRLDKLTAVVFLFDRQGGFLSSTRGSVDYLTLAAGDETPFVISMDAPPSVARYRVSFRTDGGVVPHIDRRGQEPLAAHALAPAAVKR
jgi:hypothetical protein